MAPLWQSAVLIAGFEALLMRRYLQQSLTGSFLLLFVGHSLLVAVWKILLWPLFFSPLRKLPEPEVRDN